MTVVERATEDAIRAWFHEMQECIRTVDYDRAKRMHAPDVVAFGTVRTMERGLDRLVEHQWKSVWPNIRGFTYHVDDLVWGGSGDVAWAACRWDSQGVRADETTFARSGRVTIAFLRGHDGVWRATHTHYSLYPTA